MSRLDQLAAEVTLGGFDEEDTSFLAVATIEVTEELLTQDDLFLEASPSSTCCASLDADFTAPPTPTPSPPMHRVSTVELFQDPVVPPHPMAAPHQVLLPVPPLDAPTPAQRVSNSSRRSRRTKKAKKHTKPKRGSCRRLDMQPSSSSGSLPPVLTRQEVLAPLQRLVHEPKGPIQHQLKVFHLGWKKLADGSPYFDPAYKNTGNCMTCRNPIGNTKIEITSSICNGCRGREHVMGVDAKMMTSEEFEFYGIDPTASPKKLIMKFCQRNCSKYGLSKAEFLPSQKKPSEYVKKCVWCQKRCAEDKERARREARIVVPDIEFVEEEEEVEEVVLVCSKKHRELVELDAEDDTKGRGRRLKKPRVP